MMPRCGLQGYRLRITEECCRFPCLTMTQLWCFKNDILKRQQSTALVSACNRPAAHASAGRVAGMINRKCSDFNANADARERKHLMDAHEKS